MKATILEVDGPHEGNIFNVDIRVWKNNGEGFDDKIKCVTIGNVELVVEQYLKDYIVAEQLKGKTIEVK